MPQQPQQLLSNRLYSLLIASAGAYVLLNVLHAIARSTDTYRDKLLTAYDEVMGPGSSSALDTSSAVGFTSVLGWIVVLGVYALVLVLLMREKRWARPAGIALACLGSAAALFGLIYVFFYGMLGLVVAAVIVIYAAINVAWVVTAVRTRP
ncbi:hypothetical protein FCK90_07285 [Kocuria coralli]|uniref:Uncharacterized protein n=1 Tax=Kocuria coralli TaxID=1461025 RepID=A0A5J5KWY4_9MICC|nr:hypothetical protein [Kocuria coralli]KAA9394277.1 hypothetical protein FCK90_07285 [Kocuria coralli]